MSEPSRWESACKHLCPRQWPEPLSGTRDPAKAAPQPRAGEPWGLWAESPSGRGCSRPGVCISSSAHETSTSNSPMSAHSMEPPRGNMGSQQDSGQQGSPGCPEWRECRLWPSTREVLLVTTPCGLGFRGAWESLLHGACSRCQAGLTPRPAPSHQRLPGSVGLGREGSPSCPRLASGEATSRRPVRDHCGTKGPSMEDAPDTR